MIEKNYGMLLLIKFNQKNRRQQCYITSLDF